MFVSKNNNSVIITKKKQYTSKTSWSETGYGPSICVMADKNRFYTPNHDEIEGNFLNEMDLLISYQNHFNDDNADYVIHNTNEKNYFVQNSFTANNDHHFEWRMEEARQLTNLTETNPDSSFETYTLTNNYGYINYRYNQIYETYASPKIQMSKNVPYVNATSGTMCTTTINYYNNDYFPASLGCAILFSASKIPSAQFAVGVKGGTGGSMYNFNGKLYNTNDTSHLKNLGNGMYLFYDTVIDNLNFRTTVSAKKYNSDTNRYYLYFSPPVIVGNLTFELLDGGTVVKTTNKGSFENFEYISIRAFLQFGQPNSDDAIRVLPTTASISPRYNSYAVSQFVKNSQKWCFHSKTPYSNTIPGYHSNYGYNGMSISNATEIINWGDTKYITEMNAGCAYNHTLSSIPNLWGNWENLKTTEYMFGQCYDLTTLPYTWEGLDNVTSTTSMFNYCSSLKYIPTSWEHLNNLKDAKQMFIFCNALEDIPTSWDGLNNVSSTNSMFVSAQSLTGIPQSWAGLDNLEDATSMFNSCSSLEQINLSDLLTKAPKLKNIACMFLGTKINDVNGVSAFIDACRANRYLSAVSAHSACFYNTPVASNFSLTDYPDWFKEFPE